MKITPQDLVLYFGLILTILNIIDRSSLLKEKAKAPQKEMEIRINALEDKVDRLNTYLSNDNARIENLEEGGRVLLKSLGALLSHGIDGNNVQEMKAAREELNEYLIRR
jgi:hypothetical protein